MGKKWILRALIGFPMGVFLAYTITIVISILEGRGEFYAVVPELTHQVGSEIGAAVLQYCLSGILGAGLAVSSLIWENEDWSILKRTVLHLLAMSALMFPIAYLNYWMEHTFWGIAGYFLIFFVIYAVVWAIQYFAWMRSVQAINRKLQDR